MPEMHRLRITAGPEHTDELGHVNNVVYLQWAEQIAREHADLLGFGFDDIQKVGGVFVAKRHEIQYLRSALPGDVIELVTTVRAMTGARGLRTTEFFRGEEKLAQVESEWAFVDPKSGRPKRIPESLRSLGT